MSDLYNILARLCKERGISGYRMCKDVGIQPSVMTDLKKGRRSSMKAETITKIATYFGISVESIMGELEDQNKSDLVTQKNMPALTKKDERDIKKKMDEMLELFDSNEALMFDGEPLDEETRQLLRDSYENQLRLTKQLAKAKFTPKKYRDK